jgi:hypothetical protein
MRLLGDAREDGKWRLKPYTGDFMMQRLSHFVLWLARRGDPLGCAVACGILEHQGRSIPAGGHRPRSVQRSRGDMRG